MTGSKSVTTKSFFVYWIFKQNLMAFRSWKISKYFLIELKTPKKKDYTYPDKQPVLLTLNSNKCFSRKNW